MKHAGCTPSPIRKSSINKISEMVGIRKFPSEASSLIIRGVVVDRSIYMAKINLRHVTPWPKESKSILQRLTLKRFNVSITIQSKTTGWLQSWINLISLESGLGTAQRALMIFGLTSVTK